MFITSLSTHVGMGCARWTYEPEEAVLKSAPRMDWVEGLQVAANSAPVESITLHFVSYFVVMLISLPSIVSPFIVSDLILHLF